MKCLLSHLPVIAAVCILCSGAAAQEPAPPDEALATRVAKQVAKLGSEDFSERECASAELEKIGEPALPALQEASNSSDPEVRNRAETLVTRIRYTVRRQLALVFWNNVWFTVEKDGKHCGYMNFSLKCAPDKSAEVFVLNDKLVLKSESGLSETASTLRCRPNAWLQLVKATQTGETDMGAGEAVATVELGDTGTVVGDVWPSAGVPISLDVDAKKNGWGRGTTTRIDSPPLTESGLLLLLSISRDVEKSRSFGLVMPLKMAIAYVDVVQAKSEKLVVGAEELDVVRFDMAAHAGDAFAATYWVDTKSRLVKAVLTCGHTIILSDEKAAREGIDSEGTPK